MNKKYEEECKTCEIDCNTKSELCSFCLAQKIIKGKWKMLIFWHLQKGNVRFNELNRLIPTTPTTLSRQLKELENDDVIERKVYNEIPPKVEYSLSPIGKEFTTVMESMKQWGNSYIHNLNIKN
ncbi:winged helix-turn-helix transcriptional regulator [Clostridium algidicarnis]|uniref:HxlR family transcriptional regulator n=2 Tax=Clostridium algidicarnis TaxID=37659 RepID=A0A2S6G095_9CLOT|nr:helix-turn-helix domain-containing protein [Clostridium algidicarnis]MBU3220317.1 helix-turn-helix transcriptional regulator [Clostridium algidicarnis]PPK49349.1 HxlR family transcriptional regulator [Clostridium algidicarnis DSM 15099]